MDIAIMNELIANKDKCKASQEKRTAFSQEWLSYVSENGFDETAEKYLFEGFEYRRMHPFVDYLKTAEDKQEIVFRFLNGKQFSKNKPKAFKMTLNLLAILFAELPDEQALMVHVIRRLPATSINSKDKKRMPEAGKAFEKFFFPEIKKISALPDLQTMTELKPVTVADFRALISDATRMLSEHGDVDEKIKKAYDMTIEWNKGKTSTEANTSISPEADEPVRENEGGNTDSGKIETAEAESESESEAETESAETGRKMPAFSWKSSLNFVAKTIERLESQKRILKEQIENKDHEIAVLQDTVSQKETLLVKAAEEGNNLRAKEVQLEKEIEDLRKAIDGLNQTILEKDREIADRSRLAEMLSRDTSKQSDAVLKRLSSELASYYEDFKAAEGETVTEEIGSILKDQMAEIFAILNKNGIKLQ